METALALHAVLKLRRGPTSTTPASRRVLVEVSSSCSYVSERSHSNVCASDSVSGAATAMLKHCSRMLSRELRWLHDADVDTTMAPLVQNSVSAAMS